MDLIDGVLVIFDDFRFCDCDFGGDWWWFLGMSESLNDVLVSLGDVWMIFGWSLVCWLETWWLVDGRMRGGVGCM
jgi:hypothetical protein